MAVVAVISFAFMIMDSIGYTSNQMIIDFFGAIGDAFRDNILDFKPHNPDLIMGRLIWEKTQKARSFVDPLSYAYLKNLPLDIRYKGFLFEVLEAAFYMPDLKGPHKEERDGMIQAVKDAIIWAEENGLEDNLDDVRREIEMIESVPLELLDPSTFFITCVAMCRSFTNSCSGSSTRFAVGPDGPTAQHHPTRQHRPEEPT